MKTKIWIYSSFLLILGACFDPEIKTIVFTGVVQSSTITEISAEIEGTIISLTGNISEHGHCWLEDSTKTPTIENNRTRLGERNNRGGFQSLMFGLAPNTGYAVCGYAVVDGEVVYGKKVSFKTIGESKPLLTTTQIRDISRTSAVAVGRLNNVQQGNATQHGHCWLVADVFNQVQPTVTVAGTPRTTLGERSITGDFASNVSGLSPNTTYRIRTYAIINGKAEYGNTISFTTSQ
ncbi:MAG: hypothetical protein MUE85_21515 [Microscillaceae bacterium]|jgi:hypothetical protein|nr:hypothetical protein [Microscillaceae bacterium]